MYVTNGITIGTDCSIESIVYRLHFIVYTVQFRYVYFWRLKTDESSTESNLQYILWITVF